ncbi:MAG: alanine--tRNA ligase [Planctomycetota bacterium]
MKVDELRKLFLEFFQEKGHQVCPSDSLVPANDPTLLFTGAGMNQFKDYFLGRAKPLFKRATTSQKCLRTGDIEKVGRTSAHHTFFEMLGNFSFGDYFKEDAIKWAWEFLTVRLKIPAERLRISVYQEDSEAYRIWNKEIGIPEKMIYRLGPEGNFWPANAPAEGPNGPCGPCSEIYYDYGQSVGCGLPECGVACDCGRFVEIWNLVFMEFDRRDVDELVPLAQKNIDTGMGLERIAAVMQGVRSNFDIDTFKHIIKYIDGLIEVTADQKSAEASISENTARIRRISDHSRALVMLISDGVLPSNEGRGYVERRILRRAVRDGMTMGLNKPFMHKIIPSVIEVMKSGYPELAGRREHIVRIIKAEEEKFLETVEQGMVLLDETIKKVANSSKVFPGEDAFKLYDTYGFPIDLTESILAEKGFRLDIAGYEVAMSKQKESARASSKIADSVFAKTPLDEIRNILSETAYLGSETLTAKMKVEAILAEGKVVQSAEAGAEVGIITDRTPFYAESGGQVGDTGSLHSLQAGKSSSDNVQIIVTDTQKLDKYFLHIGKVKKGAVRVGDELEGVVDAERRMAITRNHTSTHLLQNALRTIVGAHIEQAGSMVAPNRFRFDYSHFAALSNDEMKAIEDLVNRRIMENGKVDIKTTTLEDAKKQGALAFFGDKYGEKVRLVKISDYSQELCGGSHVRQTGDIGYFKILSDVSIAAGTRRIEGLSGEPAVKYVRESEAHLAEAAELLSATPAQLAAKIRALQNQLKEQQQELAKHRKNDNKEIANALLTKACTMASGKCRVIAEILENKTVDDLRNITDIIKGVNEPVIALLGTVSENKVNLLLMMHQSLVKDDFNAVILIKEVAKVIEGSGGGRKDMAQAGGKRPDKVEEALALFNQLVDRK